MTWSTATKKISCPTWDDGETPLSVKPAILPWPRRLQASIFPIGIHRRFRVGRHMQSAPKGRRLSHGIHGCNRENLTSCCGPNEIHAVHISGAKIAEQFWYDIPDTCLLIPFVPQATLQETKRASCSQVQPGAVRHKLKTKHVLLLSEPWPGGKGKGNDLSICIFF